MGMMDKLDQIKQAMQMRKEAKKMQAEIEKLTYTHKNGGITLTMKGDYTVTQLQITDEALAEAKAGKPERFEIMMRTVINAASGKIRQMTQEMAQQMMKDGNSPFGK